MHGEAVGFAVTPSVALAYAVVAAFLYGMSRQGLGVTVPAPAPTAVATPAE
jgi:AGZA family xanthine/uracil permease-like MFS transporter